MNSKTMTPTSPSAKKKQKKIKLTPEERKAKKLRSDHIRTVRGVFRNAGFDRAVEIAEKEIDFLFQKGEFDDCFVYENVILLIEYTISNSSNVGGHLKHKKIIFDKIIDNRSDFITYLIEKFPLFKDRLAEKYFIDRYRLKIVYCSRYDFDTSVKSVVDTVQYFDYPILKYFERISAAIRLSALPEIFDFLGIKLTEVGIDGVVSNIESSQNYDGLLLAEEASGFPAGYKVVSFYADAGTLLKRAFVLRRNGWRGSREAYQRMIILSKINAIREGLRKKGQVAINNIIATLPSDVLPVGADGHTYKVSTITETKPVKISLPLKANSIGLIDGQHRLFSYFNSKSDDQRIKNLRKQQNLLVTGIIYPDNLKADEAERFEAGLFLTINSNQSSAPPELRQEIEVLLNPLSATAISKQVMERLSETGPLFNQVERYFYDKGKLKTSSIVNFGLNPLLKLQGNDSLFSIYTHPNKNSLIEKSSELLDDYIKFNSTKINMFLAAVRSNVGQERWTTDPKIENRILTVTFVNSFLITMRMLISNGKTLDFDFIKPKLAGFGDFNTKPFSSSQYNRMAEKIYADFFA